MTHNVNPHHRQSIRLPGYDYSSSGAYFVTICTHNRELLFDDPRFRTIAEQQWTASAHIRAEIELDVFVVMPNHIHGIVWITQADSDAGNVRPVGAQGLAPLQPPPRPILRVTPRSLGSFVRGYKSAVTHSINTLRETPDLPVWQRNYYEHVIRSEAALDRIREYIVQNPARWAFDHDNPQGAPDAAERAFWKAFA